MRLRISCRIAIAAACVSFAHAAAVDPDLPRYEPHAVVVPAEATYRDAGGAIRIVGYNDMRAMLEALRDRFHATHPDVRIVLELPGTRFAPAALADGSSALAPMGAEFTPPQLDAYRLRRQSDPLPIRVAHASLDPAALSGPLTVFVNARNPVPSLTLAQLTAAFTGRAKTWGELGATGAWSSRPVVLFGVERGTPLALSFQGSVGGIDSYAPDMTGLPQSAEVVRRVSNDANAIGYAAAMRVGPAVRPLAIARDANAQPVLPTEDAIVSGRYPLDRFLLVHAPLPVSSFAREFLRLVLSYEGQAIVAATPQRYLPLTAREAAVERAKLEGP